jgi:hypothetical protein
MLETMSLVEAVNAGFKIIKQGTKAVIGERFLNGKMDYVVWTYAFREGKPDFFWGRYVSTIEDALTKFNQKESGEYSGD